MKRVFFGLVALVDLDFVRAFKRAARQAVRFFAVVGNFQTEPAPTVAPSAVARVHRCTIKRSPFSNWWAEVPLHIATMCG